MPTRYRPLLFGALLAPLFMFVPIVSYVGWFLASLAHETGHAALAWAAGCPAVPAIRLDGHAAAVHQDQTMILAYAIWGGLAWLAWQRKRWWFVLPVVYPVFAFTGMREVMFLLGGGLGELAFAGIFLWRAVAGDKERVASGALGSFLILRNVMLSGGLLFSDASRAAYRGNGSFGLTNDYLRLGVDVELVGFGMLLLALAVPVFLWLLDQASRPVRRELFGFPHGIREQRHHRRHDHDDRRARDDRRRVRSRSEP
jgi:hypothetical protein